MEGDVTLVFLDVAKAYGHDYLKLIFENSEIPDSLKNLIISLQMGNKTYLDLGSKISKQIRGVLQRAPLSPMLFNTCINSIFEELSEKAIVNSHGYLLSENLEPITIITFADDIVLICRNLNSAKNLLLMVEDMLFEIGLTINPKKSSVIIIGKEKLQVNDLRL